MPDTGEFLSVADVLTRTIRAIAQMVPTFVTIAVFEWDCPDALTPLKTTAALLLQKYWAVLHAFIQATETLNA